MLRLSGSIILQDLSWEDQGYSCVDELYNEMADILDKKFTLTQNLTYFTLVFLSLPLILIHHEWDTDCGFQRWFAIVFVESLNALNDGNV